MKRERRSGGGRGSRLKNVKREPADSEEDTQNPDEGTQGGDGTQGDATMDSTDGDQHLGGDGTDLAKENGNDDTLMADEGEHGTQAPDAEEQSMTIERTCHSNLTLRC